MSKTLEGSNIIEMTMALVCVLDNGTVIEILKGEGYEIQDIREFIEYCER